VDNRDPSPYRRGVTPGRVDIGTKGRTELSEPVANLIAKYFIARPDVKAIQHSDGSWAPHTETRKADGPRIPWRREDLNAHLAGEKTFGHYVINQTNDCKLFAFDIDLEQNKPADSPRPFQGYYPDEDGNLHEFDPRESWRDRAHPSRKWQKYQLKMMSSILMKTIYEELEIPCAAAYSGGKGVHVYGFTGLMSAAEAREGAHIVLDAIGNFEATRGSNFYKWKDRDPSTGYPNLSIEVFPKQDSLDGKDLGNLMRCPLGRNRRSADPTFFIDMRTPMSDMVPVDPTWALTTTNPWSD